jgi:hypothetical protein
MVPSPRPRSSSWTLDERFQTMTDSGRSEAHSASTRPTSAGALGSPPSNPWRSSRSAHTDVRDGGPLRRRSARSGSRMGSRRKSSRWEGRRRWVGPAAAGLGGIRGRCREYGRRRSSRCCRAGLLAIWLRVGGCSARSARRGRRGCSWCAGDRARWSEGRGRPASDPSRLPSATRRGCSRGAAARFGRARRRSVGQRCRSCGHGRRPRL